MSRRLALSVVTVQALPLPKGNEFDIADRLSEASGRSKSAISSALKSDILPLLSPSEVAQLKANLEKWG